MSAPSSSLRPTSAWRTAAIALAAASLLMLLALVTQRRPAAPAAVESQLAQASVPPSPYLLPEPRGACRVPAPGERAPRQRQRKAALRAST